MNLTLATELQLIRLGYSCAYNDAANCNFLRMRRADLRARHWEVRWNTARFVEGPGGIQVIRKMRAPFTEAEISALRAIPDVDAVLRSAWAGAAFRVEDEHLEEFFTAVFSILGVMNLGLGAEPEYVRFGHADSLSDLGTGRSFLRIHRVRFIDQSHWGVTLSNVRKDAFTEAEVNALRAIPDVLYAKISGRHAVFRVEDEDDHLEEFFTDVSSILGWGE